MVDFPQPQNFSKNSSKSSSKSIKKTLKKKVDLVNQKVNHDGLLYHNDYTPTPKEKEILKLLTEEFLTPKQIYLSRRISKQAVYKIIKNLKKKGLINVGFQKVDYTRCTPPQCPKKVNQKVNQIRLHGQEINLRIITKTPKYNKLIKHVNLTFIDSNNIRLYNNSIEIYSGHSFYGKDNIEAFSKSLNYWSHFFERIQHELGITIKKNRSKNIKIVKQHYARTDSEVYENAIEHKEPIYIYAKEDGKLAFITDNSFNLKEDECIHPVTAHEDREKIDKQINDWRINDPPTNSELAIHLYSFIDVMNLYSKNMVSHVKAIQDLGKGVNKLNKLLDLHKSKINKQYLNKQKTLFDY